MHIKINKHLLDPNFLTAILWTKTRLHAQQLDHGPFEILNYAITFKTKHNSRINVYNSSRIMINSPEVNLDI
jgi:hypothetical protein